MKFSEWEKSVERGTSGDMVWDILSDWKAQIKLTREGLLQSLTDIKPLGDEGIQTAIDKTPVVNMPAPISRQVDIEATQANQLRAIAQASHQNVIDQISKKTS